MKATWAATANCEELTASDPFVINKRPLTVHKEDTKVYNGSEQTMAITAGDIQEGTSLAAEETLEINASIKGTDVNTYTELAEGSTWKVMKGDADVTSNYDITVTGQLTITKAGSAEYQGRVTLDDWTYGDEAKAEVSSTTGGDYAAPTYEYKKADASDDTYTSEKPSESGSYIVKATWAETANCNELTDTDTFVIAKRPITVTANSASKTYDATPLVMNASEITSGELVSGHSYEATIEGSQTFVGNSSNTIVDVKVYDADEQEVTSNYEIVKAPGTLTVTDGTPDKPVDPNKVVTKTHEDKTYGLGDTIVFNIEVTNIYNEAKTITISEQEGVTITGQSVFENVAPGEKVTTTAEYVVTEADLLAGTFTNKVTASFDGGKDFENTDTVDDFEDTNGHLTISKDTTSTPANGEAYALGETITYKITATNDGNLTLTNVEVVDELTGDKWNVESIAPGESKDFTAEYIVKEADILAGSVVNVATATGESPDPDKPDPGVDPGEKEEPTDPKNGHLTLAKTATSTPANGTAYSAGETVTYRITAANDGNLTLTNVEVADKLTGDVWMIESLAPGESREFTTAYVVTEADVLAGSVVNVATADGESPDPDKPDPEVNPDEEVVPTNSDYTVTIHYIDANGNTVAPDYTGTFTYQTPFSVTSPVIDGYTPSAAVVNGTMPAENIEYVVIYTAEDVPVIVPPVPVPTPTPTPNPEPIVNTPEVPETETPETETPETEETDDNAGYDLSVVDDEEVPLADMNDNHKCCILHFLILCLGLLIEIWYTHDQKKRQKKIFELREMLAEQTNGEIR